MPYKNASAIVALMSLVLSLPALAADAVPNFVTDAVGFPNRAQWQIVRDVARKPDAVLRFSQIKPGMAVAELVPGDGYYTWMLSHLVGKKGKVYAIVPSGGARAKAWRMQQRVGKLPAAMALDDGQ